jgi:hypothetical protein
VTEYPPPVNQLLTQGDPRSEREWPDYLKRGLKPEHIPDLIRLATDPVLNQGDPESKEVWGPLHAWRALGQLRAAEAVGPLLTLLTDDDEFGDWEMEELPEVFGMIGPPAIPPLVAFLDDLSHGTYARSAADSGLTRIAEKHPETRAECVAAITRELERAKENDPSLNGLLVGDLLKLKAVEAAPAIERAFAAGAVEEFIVGDWPEVEYQLGLTDKPPARRPFFRSPFPGPFPPLPPSSDQHSRKAKTKAKAKRKTAAKSRKRNRKRK